MHPKAYGIQKVQIAQWLSNAQRIGNGITYIAIHVVNFNEFVWKMSFYFFERKSK